jgi:hypothetical protein
MPGTRSAGPCIDNLFDRWRQHRSRVRGDIGSGPVACGGLRPAEKLRLQLPFNQVARLVRCSEI